MRAIKQIEDELRRTGEHVEELTGIRDETGKKLKLLQDDFINGKATAEALQGEQIKLTAIEDSIKSLAARRSGLEKELSEAKAAQTETQRLEALKQTALEVETAYTEYLELRNDFNELIREYAEKLLGKTAFIGQKKREFQSLFREFMPNPNVSRADDIAITNQTFAKLDAIGLPASARELTTDTYFRLPPLEFTESIANVEGIFGNQLQREFDKRRKSESQLAAA